jgi:alcohol dehydrogenase
VAFQAGWQHVRTGGTLVLVGAVFPSAPVPLELEQVVRRQLTLRGVHNYAPRHLEQAVAFLERTWREFPFASLVGPWIPLAQVPHAFELGRRGESIRVGVAMPVRG